MSLGSVMGINASVPVPFQGIVTATRPGMIRKFTVETRWVS
jgi:hypothetical protein